jgi:hypothetical protein
MLSKRYVTFGWPFSIALSSVCQEKNQQQLYNHFQLPHLRLIETGQGQRNQLRMAQFKRDRFTVFLE